MRNPQTIRLVPPEGLGCQLMNSSMQLLGGFAKRVQNSENQSVVSCPKAGHLRGQMGENECPELRGLGQPNLGYLVTGPTWPALLLRVADPPWGGGDGGDGGDVDVLFASLWTKKGKGRRKEKRLSLPMVLTAGLEHGCSGRGDVLPSVSH